MLSTGRRVDALWTPVLPRPKAVLRLFCFPYAGGTAAACRMWPAALPPHIEVCAVQLPGRSDKGQPPFTEIGPLIASLGPMLLPAFSKPYAFFGHSVGGVVAFELTRWLRDRQQSGPRHLFVSGRRAPHLPDDDPWLHPLPDDAFVASIARLGGIPDEVLANRELLAYLLPTLRADVQLSETYAYKPGAPCRCPITAFGGADDDETSGRRLDEWRQHSTSLFRGHVLAGGHFFLHSDEANLLRLLRAELSMIAALSYPFP